MKKNKEVAPYYTNHGRPTTRREFLARSATAVGTTLAFMPTIETILAQKAFALNTGCAASVITKASHICLDATGGVGMLAQNVVAGKTGGQDDRISNAGYAQLGIDGARLPSVTAPTLIGGLQFYSGSQVAAGIMQTASAAALANVTAFAVPILNNDDTNQNPHNIGDLMFQIIGKGALTSQTTSNANSITALATRNPAATPVQVNSVAQARGLVEFNRVVQNFGSNPTVMEKLMKAIGVMSKGQIESFGKMAPTAQVQALFNCGFKSAADGASKFNADMFDVTKSEIAGIFNGADQNEIRVATACLLTQKSVGSDSPAAGSASVGMGGYDYHGTSQANKDTMDMRLGRAIGIVLQAAHVYQRFTVCDQISDGAVSFNPGNIPAGPNSDAGQHGLRVCYVYKPGGGNVLKDPTNNFFGACNDGGAVDTRATTFAGNAEFAGYFVALQIAAMLGVTPDKLPIISESFGGDVAAAALIKTKKSV